MRSSDYEAGIDACITAVRRAAARLEEVDPQSAQALEAVSRALGRLRGNRAITPLCQTCRVWGQGACAIHQREAR